MNLRIIVGRFALRDIDRGLRIAVGLYGTHTTERSLETSATRREGQPETGS